mgnify:FL=1
MVPQKKFATSNLLMKELKYREPVAKVFGQTKKWRLEDVCGLRTQTRGTNIRVLYVWLLCMYVRMMCVTTGSEEEVKMMLSLGPRKIVLLL